MWWVVALLTPEVRANKRAFDGADRVARLWLVTTVCGMYTVQEDVLETDKGNSTAI